MGQRGVGRNRWNQSEGLVDESPLSSRYERVLFNCDPSGEGLASAIARSAQKVRAAHNATGETQALVEVATGVVAPFYISNLVRCLKVARDGDLSTLVFAPGPGELLSRISKLLAPNLGYSGDLTWLRYPEHRLLLASQSESRAVPLEYLLPQPHPATTNVRNAVARLGLTPEQLGTTFRASIPARAWEQPLDGSALKRLRLLVAEDPLVSAEVQRESERQRAVLLRHLRDTHFARGGQIGVVDTGLDGSFCESVSRVLQGAGECAPTILAFGLPPTVSTQSGHWLSRTSQQKCASEYLTTQGMLAFIDLVARATQKPVSQYAEGGTGTCPPTLFRDARPGQPDRAQVAHDAIYEVARLLDADLDGPTKPTDDLRLAVAENFELFRDAPSGAEMKAWKPSGTIGRRATPHRRRLGVACARAVLRRGFLPS